MNLSPLISSNSKKTRKPHVYKLFFIGENPKAPKLRALRGVKACGGTDESELSHTQVLSWINCLAHRTLRSPSRRISDETK